MNVSALFNAWISSLTSPVSTFQSQRSQSTLTGGIVNLLLASVIAGLLLLIVPSFLGSKSTDASLVISLAIAVYLVGTLVWQAIVFTCAKLLGGKGSYVTQVYLVSLPAPAMAVLSAIPLLNIVAGLYNLYLHVIAVRETHQFSTLKAAASIIIPAIALFIITLIFFAALLIPLIGSSLSGSR